MKEITVKNRQNALDIALQEYGEVSGIFQLALDNPQAGLNELGLDSLSEPQFPAPLPQGRVVKINPEEVLRPDIKDYLDNQQIEIITGYQVVRRETITQKSARANLDKR